MEHDICRLYRLQSVQSEQPCVAGACADKDDFAFCRAEAVKLRSKLCFGGIKVALGGKRVKTAVEQVFPKAATAYCLWYRNIRKERLFSSWVLPEIRAKAEIGRAHV